MVTFGKQEEKKSETGIEEIKQKIISHSPTGFLEAKAKQELHHIICLMIGDRPRWIAHAYPKSTDKQFVYGQVPNQHTFAVDSTQEPLFEDEKARPVYISVLGSVGPASTNGSMFQPVGNGDGKVPAIDTSQITIKKLEDQDSNVHNKLFEQREMEAILAAGTRNALPNPNPVWMQFLAFGGIPIGIIIGVVIAPYIGKALGGG